MPVHLVRRLLMALFATVLVAGLTQASPASAAPPRLTSLTLVSQDWANKSLKVSWSWAKGHTYQVKYSHNANLSGAQYQDATTDRGTWLNKNIAPGRTLYVTARAVLNAGKPSVTYGPWSSVLKTALKPKAVGTFGSVAVKPVADGIELSWGAVADASHYQVRQSAGPNPNRTPDKWGNRWVSWFSAFNPVVRKRVASGSDADLTKVEYGNPIYAEVQAKNDFYSTTYTRKAKQVVGWPAPAPVGRGADVSVGTYNVQCNNCGTTPWSQRRANVVANLVEADLDVVVLTEANDQQDTDVLNGLNRAGGDWTLIDAQEYLGNKILFDAEKLSLVDYEDSGHGVLDGVYDYSQPETEFQYVPWARLQANNSESVFYVVGAHFENPRNLSGAAKKTKLGDNADQLLAALDVLNPGRRLPVVVAGDLNDQRYPEGRTDGPQATLVRDGDFYDSSASQQRFGTAFPTFNGSKAPSAQQTDANGDGLRIDYILTQGFRGSKRFQNVWNPGLGGVVPSDHNLILTDLVVPPIGG